MTRSFRNFLVVGGLAALANWGSRFIFQPFMNLSLAVVAAYVVGMLVSFTLNRLWVFEPSGRRIADEAVRFTLVNIVSFGLVWLITLGLAEMVFPAVGFTWHADAVAHGIGVVSPAAASYLGHRYFTFARSEGPAPPERASSPGGDLPLAVDMDGTLLRTDVLAEAMVAGLFHNPLSVIRALPLLRRGRAPFKARMAMIAPLEVARLPARGSLLTWLRAEKARGRPLYLVTAGAHDVAVRVADRFKIFDGVHASGDSVNLKGARKLAYLQQLFPDGFVYAGDSAADIAVWRGAAGVVIAGATRSVAGRARATGKPIEGEFDIGGAGLRAWRKTFRLHQWAKNLLLFAPLALSAQVSSPRAWIACVIGFVLMGIAASATYVINDLADLENDRGHRTKFARPLASGAIPVHTALAIALAMLVFAFVGAAILSPPFTLALAAYLVITLSYSFRLKRVALLDVMTLGVLYSIRLICGTLLAGAVFSPWLLTFSVFFFFSMSLAKRHVEVSTATSPPDQLLAGRGYKPSDAPLTLSLGVATSAAAVLIIVQYMVAEAFPSNVYAFPAALWIAPFLLALWICRIWLLAHRGELDDDPVAFAVKDKVSLGLGLLLGLAFLLARY
jgi:4-hydroxybenzoate polyprenyltransferase/putative flippase GtrA